MELFSERIAFLRQEKHLTQRELAEKLGLAHRSYQSYEYGERFPDFHGLIAIADFFDVSLDYLVGRSDVRQRR